MDLKKLAKDIAWQAYKMPDLGSHFMFEPAKWIAIPLFQEALEGGKPVLTASWEGTLVTDLDRLTEALSTISLLRVVKVDHRTSSNRTVMMACTDTMLMIETNERGKSAYATLATNNEEVLRKIGPLLSRCMVPEDPSKGLVYVLAKEMSGYNIRRLGAAGTPLERGNYTPEVLADYDHVLTDLNTHSPCGRLIILSGSPGTGKTFLIRSLLTQTPRAAFIMVPPHMVQDLNGPEILPALTQAKNENVGPVVLLIEDADSCLVTRKEGNMNAISSLLNLGDGILGAVLDIRIIATTNATKLEIDQATQRPGRLCRHTIVGQLDVDTASKALQRLVQDGKPWRFREPRTIAEVYQEARKRGWRPQEIVPARMQERPELLD